MTNPEQNLVVERTHPREPRGDADQLVLPVRTTREEQVKKESQRREKQVHSAGKKIRVFMVGLRGVDNMDWFEVLKKKKKPFKGYNKKIHARTGGLSAKGRAKFKRETGANLKKPVTTKPSKLKPGSKAAKRRKSFCARSRGFKRKDGTYSEKARAARRRWNC